LRERVQSLLANTSDSSATWKKNKAALERGHAGVSAFINMGLANGKKAATLAANTLGEFASFLVDAGVTTLVYPMTTILTRHALRHPDYYEVRVLNLLYNHNLTSPPYFRRTLLELWKLQKT
jgi:hypothetical protein